MIKYRTALVAGLLALMLVAGLIIPTAPRARAQSEAAPESGIFRSNTLEMTVKAGFDQLEVSYYSGIWVPFRITLANAGEPITGRIVVQTESRPNPNSQARDFVKDIQLPTGSRQFHEIPVYISSGHKDPEISLVSDGQIVARTSVKVGRGFSRSEDLKIAVVDTDSTTLNNITSTDIFQSPTRKPFRSGALPNAAEQSDQELSEQPSAPAPPQTGRSRRGRTSSNQQVLLARPTVIPPEDLPRDFVSYEPLDVVVIGDAPLSQLTAEQARALRLWIASGGMLIVTGAADVAGLRATGLDAILPTEIQGSVTLAALPELTGIYGRFESGDPPLIMSASVRPEARALVGSDDMPLVAEKNYGSGLVRFVAYNPKLNPYRGWGGTKYLWTDLLLPAAESKSNQAPGQFVRRRRGQNSVGVQDFLFNLAEIEPPSASYFLLFLLFYILIVGPVNYFALRKMKKLDLAWLTIPGVVLLFTAVSVVIAQVSRGGSSIAADVSLVEVHQREGTSRALGTMLIMPSSKGTRDISFEGRDTYVRASDNSNSPMTSTGDPVEFEREQDQSHLRVPMTTWTSNVFILRSMGEGEAPLIAVSEGAGAQVKVKNLGDAAITGAVYVSAEGISKAFDLAPGEEREIALSVPESTSFYSWYMTQLTAGSQEAEVFESLSPLLDGEIGGDQVFKNGFFDEAQMPGSVRMMERPILIGFVEKGQHSMSFSGSLKRRSKSLYVIHL